MQLIKQYIANGQAVAFSGHVLCGYCNPVPLQDGVIYESAYVPNSGHGQLVVGYDDDVGTPGNTGALLVQNSFGTDWPPASSHSPAPPGMVYWSYNSFGSTQGQAAVAYPRSPGPPAGFRLSRSPRAPLASITKAFQWAPDSPPGVYLILTHFFGDPVLLESVALTEPGDANRLTATAAYGQYISTGYSYLTRTDGRAFLSGTWAVTLEGRDVSGNPISYTGAVVVGAPQPSMPTGASMAGQIITGSTGAVATLVESTPSGISLTGSASRVGQAAAPGKETGAKVGMVEKFTFSGLVDLGASTLTIHSLLDEPGGAGELVKGLGGVDLVPLTLVARPGGKPNYAIFETPSGAVPKVRVEMQTKGQDIYDWLIRVERTTIPAFPQRCTGGSRPATSLATSYTIDDGVNPPVQVSAVKPWRCLDLIGGDPQKPRSLRTP